MNEPATNPARIDDDAELTDLEVPAARDQPWNSNAISLACVYQMCWMT